MAEIEPGEYVDTYINLPSTQRQSEESMRIIQAIL